MPETFARPPRHVHAEGRVMSAGAAPDDMNAAVVLLHGRGASAASMLPFSEALALDRVHYVAIQATGATWYPYSFLAPIATNQPWLDSALSRVHDLVSRLEARLSARRIVLLGFSQGACLASEYAARRGTPLGGVVVLSGGLIGTDEVPDNDPPADKAFDYSGSMNGSRIFMGCSDVDPHIPVTRVHDSADVFTRLGAHVDKRIYEGMAHTVIDDEIAAARSLIQVVRDESPV